jgi:hypothetical protein
MSEDTPPVPVPYVRQKRRKRGRPKKVGRPRLDKEPDRDSPSQRTGQRYKTITVNEEAYYILKELSAFYKVSMGVYVYSLLLPAFDHAYQESITLQRIDANRKKAKDETPSTDDVPRRTHF